MKELEKAVCEESGEERVKELLDLYWNETNDEETQEWREDLTPTEKKLVRTWDKDYDDLIGSIVSEIEG